MGNHEQKTSGVFSFQINGRELGTVVFDVLKLRPEEYSPLREAVKQHHPETKKNIEQLHALVENNRVTETLRILAAPDIIMENRYGGGGGSSGVFIACRGISVNENAWAVMLRSYNGSFLFYLFDSPHLYAAWWADLYGTGVSQKPAGLFPEHLTLESLIYILHAIDSYKRGLLLSQVNYTDVSSSIDLAEYIRTLRQAIKSADLRWLLPTFLSLTPLLDFSRFDVNPEHMHILSKFDFLQAVNRTGGSVDMMFGKVGQAVGKDFSDSWHGGSGFAISIVHNAGRQVLHKGFLAPTARATYLFGINDSGDEPIMIQCFSLTKTSLKKHLTMLLFDALKAEPDRRQHGDVHNQQMDESRSEESDMGSTTDSDDVQKAGQADQGNSDEQTGKGECPRCGAIFEYGQKFCTSCGQKIPGLTAQKRLCSGCGKEIIGKVKFCTHCGTSVPSLTTKG